MAELKPYRIYDYMLNTSPEQHTIPPYDLPYNILGLHKKHTIVRGELLKLEFYGGRDIINDTWSNLCVVEERQYNRQGGYVYHRLMDISYIHEDGTTGATQQTNKFYTLPQAIDEGVRRRGNIISQLKIDVIGIIAATQQLNLLVAEDIAKELLREIEYELSLYIDGDELPFVNKFFDLDFDVLDNVIPEQLVPGNVPLRLYIIDSVII